MASCRTARCAAGCTDAGGRTRSAAPRPPRQTRASDGCPTPRRGTVAPHGDRARPRGADRQRGGADARARHAHHAARPAARAPRPDRRQEGLRPRPVRRVHRADRRPPRAQLPRPRRRPRTAPRSPRSRASPTATSCTRCRRRSSTHDAFQCGYCTPGPDLLGGRDARRGGPSASTAGDGADRRSTGRDPRADERQPVPLRRLRRTSCAAIAGGRAVRPFAYERPATPRTRSPRSPRTTAGRPFLGGGTNLVDLMKLGVAEPDVLVDVTPPPARPRSSETADGGLRIGAAVRNSDLAADPRRARALPRARRRRCSPARPGQLRNMATVGGNLLQRTRCPYFQDVTKPCNKREPGSGCPAHRRATTATSPILGHSEHCVATHPSDMAVALAALDAVVHVDGPGRRARDRRSPDLHRLPGDEPERDTVLEPGRPDHRGRAAALPLAAALGATARSRDRASFAFARRLRRRRARRRRRHGRDVRHRARRRAHVPWRAHRAEEALRGAPATSAAFAAAADAELAAGRPAARQRASRCRWPATLLVRTLAELCRPMTTRATRAVGRAARRGSRAARRSRARRRYAFEHPADGVAYAVARAGHRRRGRDARASTRRRRGRCPACSPSLSHDNAPRAASDADDPELRRAPVAATSPTAGRSSPRSSPRRLEAAREAAARACASTTTPSRHDVVLRADHPALYAPEKVNPASRPTREHGDVDGALAAAAVAVDATYATPAFHNNPMEPHATLARLGGRRPRRCTTPPGRATRRATRSRQVFGLEPERVRVISPARRRRLRLQGHAAARTSCSPRWPRRSVGRPVKLAVTRQQMFALTGLPHADDPARCGSAPTRDGRLAAIAHDVVEQTSTVKEFAEQTAVGHADDVRGARTGAPRTGSPRSTCRRRRGCARRASARACSRSSRRWTSSPSPAGIDPIELRIRNEPDVDPESGHAVQLAQPRRLPARGRRALRLGRPRPAPGRRRDGRWLVGTGVAASTYPAYAGAGAGARARVEPTAATSCAIARRRHRHRRAHRADPDRRRRARRRRSSACGVEIGDSALPAGAGRRRLDGHRARGARRSSRRARRCATSSATTPAGRRARPTATRRTIEAARASSRATRSARSSPRSASTRTPARSACRACSACSPPAASSTRSPPARSSSAA